MWYDYYTRLQPERDSVTSGKDRIVAIHLAQESLPIEERLVVGEKRALDGGTHPRSLSEWLQQKRIELDGRCDPVDIDIDEGLGGDPWRWSSDGRRDASRYRRGWRD